MLVLLQDGTGVTSRRGGREEAVTSFSDASDLAEEDGGGYAPRTVHHVPTATRNSYIRLDDSDHFVPR